MRINRKYLIVLLGIAVSWSVSLIAQDGGTIFKQNCAACHKLGKRLVGPDLLGISEKRSQDWLVKFIKSSQTLIKSGDAEAVAIFEEYNQTIMNDQAHLSDDQIMVVLDYIKAETAARGSAGTDIASEVKEEVEETPIVYSEADIERGKELYSGNSVFKAGGPSCISCHHVNNNQIISGGRLAKDLTNVYSRMGDAGIAGILNSPPFPAMASSYAGNALDSMEVAQLTAFLKHADEVSGSQVENTGIDYFVIGGGGGLLLILLLIGLHWRNRLKHAVKEDIFSRQLKGNDSKL